MRTCKLHPLAGICQVCMDMAEQHNDIPVCSECSHRARIYKLLGVGTSFWSGDYAFVEYDGRIEKVSLIRVYDIKEE